ncbi:MAG: N-acetyltransferase [Rhizobiales bacterium]|nr:N-acetyltransferase [Hyphomicrobiales bacterium]
MLTIRPETPQDAAAIRTLTNTAFASAPVSAGTEAAIIDALRDAGALALSLVATEEGEIVGHVAFSPVHLDAAAGDWFGIGPISVRPDRQRAGIGSALMREGLRQIRERGAAGCVLVGDPAYYGRFGFVHDPELRLGDVPPPYLQRLAFHDGEPKGEVRFHEAFAIH